jgi:prepilin-type N-terminal cleavage/methylation domain-containing protein/prepilin-type processing-associated H-X9-DG protein
MRSSPRGFTLVELLVVMGIIALLATVLMSSFGSALTSAKAVVSMNNLRQLAAANVAYSVDNNGYYCPAAKDANYTYLWCGSRVGSTSTYDPTQGYLSPYLGQSRQVKICPLFAAMTIVDSFDAATGGYGYNEVYIGGSPSNVTPYQPIKANNIPRPAMTVMFTTTALAKSNGLQEYPFCEPPNWPDPSWGAVQASVHFRDNGRALVAWCDGHVTAELPSQLGTTDYYGGNSTKSEIGWFGPTDNNGYWNPAYTGP